MGKASKTAKAKNIQITKTENNASIFEGILIAFFCAFIIMTVRMHTYERPMDSFFWSSGGNQVVDFFSFFKMVFVLACGGLALIMILLRVLSRTMPIQKSFAYLPMAVYSLFVLLSYAFSDYKEFSLLGYNDRFEGTLPLLCYMIFLFFVINRINTERDLKWVIVPLGFSGFVLSLLGLSQALDQDFFRSDFGKKLITPSWFWENVDSLNFTFQNKEIYQTVYNINYVSFYLTLLLPLFGMLFIREAKLRNKIVLGALFTLLIYNLIGSQSSGGIMGMGVVVILALIILNKRILAWWKPVLILVLLTLAVSGVTYERWSSELNSAIGSVAQEGVSTAEEAADVYIDYFKTEEKTLAVSLNGTPFTIEVSTAPDGSFAPYLVRDEEGKTLTLSASKDPGVFTVDDARIPKGVSLAYASDGTSYYLLLNVPGKQWPFKMENEKLVHVNELGKTLALRPIPAYGFESNQDFGSGRGYIWSRTLPMLKETILIGHGADTYCIYFPHEDYAGKFNASWNINMIVDKPHNMYLGAAVGTGVLSVLALLTLFGFYALQSALLYFRSDFKDSFATFAGAGIFLGICGFLVSGLVDDSSISVMPMFYTLLGTGFAINRMLKKQAQ